MAARLLDVARTGRVVHTTAAGHSVAAVLETSFAKLDALADTVLDTAIPPGDAVVPTPSGPTASISTICSACLWDLPLARLAGLSASRQVPLPLWRSSNLSDGDAINQRHLDDYRAAIPML